MLPNEIKDQQFDVLRASERHVRSEEPGKQPNPLNPGVGTLPGFSEFKKSVPIPELVPRVIEAEGATASAQPRIS